MYRLSGVTGYILSRIMKEHIAGILTKCKLSKELKKHDQESQFARLSLAVIGN